MTLLRPALPRRRGTALIAVLLLVLFFTSTTLVLLGSSQTSHMQSTGQRAKAQANAVMDAGVQSIINDVLAKTLTETASSAPIAFGAGDYSYDMREPEPNPGGRFVEIDVTGRVQTGHQQFTHSRSIVTAELIPMKVALPGAITLDSTNGGQGGTTDGNDLVIDYNGRPGTVSGVDINDVTLAPEPDSPPIAGVAVTSLASEDPTDPEGSLIDVTKVNDDRGNLTGMPAVNLEAEPPPPSLLASIQAKAETSTNVVTGGGTTYGAAFTPPDGYGTPEEPTVLVVEIDALEDGIRLAGIGHGYGVIYIKTGDWAPTAANSALIAFSGASYWHGLIYIETGEVQATGTNSAVFSVDGQAKILGGVVIGARDEFEYPDDTQSYALVNISGGGTGNNIVYSSSGLEYAAAALDRVEDVKIRSYRLITGME
jgi:hypothetical protein